MRSIALRLGGIALRYPKRYLVGKPPPATGGARPGKAALIFTVCARRARCDLAVPIRNREARTPEPQLA